MPVKHLASKPILFFPLYMDKEGVLHVIYDGRKKYNLKEE